MAVFLKAPVLSQPAGDGEMAKASSRTKIVSANCKPRYAAVSLLFRYYWRRTKRGIASAGRHLRPWSSQP